MKNVRDSKRIIITNNQVNITSILEEGDMVEIIAGSNKGLRGNVEEINKEENTFKICGIWTSFKYDLINHTRPNSSTIKNLSKIEVHFLNLN